MGGDAGEERGEGGEGGGRRAGGGEAGEEGEGGEEGEMKRKPRLKLLLPQLLQPEKCPERWKRIFLPHQQRQKDEEGLRLVGEGEGKHPSLPH